MTVKALRNVNYTVDFANLGLQSLSPQPGPMSATAVRGDATLGLGFKLLSHLGLAEAHAHAPSVLVNELYTT